MNTTINFNIDYHNLDAVVKNLDIFKYRYKIIRLIKITKNRATYIVNDSKVNKKKVLKFMVSSYISNNLLGIYNFFMNNEHKNFIKINSITNHDIITMIDMDYIEGYNLFDYFMNTSDRINCYNILFDLVFALNHIHNNNIIHGDIKPNNIIINNKGEPIIIDYDLCKYINNDVIESRPFGTKIFMPPELINDNIYLKKSDIWSLGISFTISILHKFNYINCDNIITEDAYKILLYYFNANKKQLINNYGKLFINSINIMIVENYKIRVSSNMLSDILKQSNYYIHKKNIKVSNKIKRNDINMIKL